uniref:Uncharacterized protein n=1 Tax=Arundo donax TaxID=35708 RepID=A0A0A9HIG1_ARUDO
MQIYRIFLCPTDTQNCRESVRNLKITNYQIFSMSNKRT